MIRNYIKIAWRNVLKYKMYSAIKIGGFALSIGACILIALFINNELSFDRSYPDNGRIYRIVGAFNNQGVIEKSIAFPAPMTKVIMDDFPEVELAGRLMPNSLFYGAGSNQLMTSTNNESVYEEGFTYFDQELMDILQVPMVYGNREQALLEPMSMVISEEKAHKYFPNQNPVGQIVYLNNDKTNPYTIKGVMAGFPTTSHLHAYDFLLTISGDVFYDGEQDNWGSNNYVSYVKLRTGTDYKAFEKKLTAQILEKYVIPNAIRSGNNSAAGFFKSASLNLQPIRDIHLQSYDILHDYNTKTRGDIRFVWLFGGIAGFILLIACINFINLSTAKSANRAKEVGLRKVVGSHRSALIAQFLTESMLYSFLSFTMGVIIAWLALPLFNSLSGKLLSFPWSNVVFFIAILGSTLLIGLLAGLYPAFYLSGFKPIQVLKGQVSRGSKNPVLRSGLVVFQFTTSIILIIGTLIINSQMEFILNKKIGYDKDQVMVIQGTTTLGGKITTFKEELQQLPQVASVSVGDYLPVRISGVKRNGNPFWKEGKSKEDAAVFGQMWETDEDFVKTLGMELVEGRGFSRELATDSQAVIINEAMVKSLNLKNPIGARITNGQNFTVIGVVKDFNFESLREDIVPLSMTLSNSPSMVSVKINANGMASAMKEISALWKELSPNQAIRFSFLDESYAHMYEGVQRMGYIYSCFAVLAIVIACLGLFGLAAFTTEQRTKEMGIRKVLGASVNSIVQLLSKEFVKLVLIAILIASPLAWWAMNVWLEDFAYRIEIQWWMFVLAGLTALAITLITVSFQAVKAAVANPVDSLRDE